MLKKKKNALDKIEKLILVCSLLVLLILIGAGVFYSKNRKPVPYKSDYSQAAVAENNDDVVLKSKSFSFPRNASLDTDDASQFFDGSVENLNKVELNLNKVDMSAAGSYKASAKYKDKKFSFTVKVEESQNPLLKAENPSFKYIVGPYSTIDEVIALAGVTATDKDGNDITDDIVGWPDSLPASFEKTTYRLNVTDKFGNVGYINITVDFQKV